MSTTITILLIYWFGLLKYFVIKKESHYRCASIVTFSSMATEKQKKLLNQSMVKLWSNNITQPQTMPLQGLNHQRLSKTSTSATHWRFSRCNGELHRPNGAMFGEEQPSSSLYRENEGVLPQQQQNQGIGSPPPFCWRCVWQRMAY